MVSILFIGLLVVEMNGTGNLKLDNMKYEVKNGDVTIPLDIFADVALTMEKMADRFNCNDGGLEEMGLEWWYHHKLNRRVQRILNNLEIKD